MSTDTKSGPVVAWQFGLARIGRLARKEISESLRDRRTVMTLVLMPLLLYPLLAITFRTVLLGNAADKGGPVYRVGVEDEARVEELRHHLQAGGAVIAWRNKPEGSENGDLPVPPHHQPMPRLKFVAVPDVEQAVADGSVAVGVRLRTDQPFGEVFKRGLDVPCDLYYREDSAEGRAAVRHLEQLITEGNALHLASQLRAIAKRPGWYPVLARVQAVRPTTVSKSPLLPVLVPLILILMTITGAVYPAIDLTAGERERGTLEILVAAPIPRMSVLLAKYAAVWTVAMLTALVNVTAMTVTLWASGIGSAVFGTDLTLGVLLQVLALLLLFAAFFSAVLLAITSFARSFKEAQAYLIPLMLLALTPGVMALLPGLTLDGPLVVVPLINIVLLARDLFEGSAHLGGGIVVVITTLLYALAAVAVAARIFGTEAVLSSEQSGWSDFLSRPRQPVSAPALSGALTCLALLFPAYFVLTGGLTQVTGLSPEGRLVLMAVANMALFGGLPLLSAWSGRVIFHQGFRLRWPGLAFCLAGLLLGLSLWPLASELIPLLRQAGFATLPQEHLERIQQQLEQWRALPPWTLVLVLAVVPALFEELFFRGYLFRALEATGKPLLAVGVSAALFAVFHLLVTDSLAVERLPLSLLLGLVLGALAWKSGSIWPGVLLHSTHNGVLVLLAYYQPWLLEWGWLASADHLPPALLTGASAVAVLGLVWVAFIRRPAEAKGT